MHYVRRYGVWPTLSFALFLILLLGCGEITQPLPPPDENVDTTTHNYQWEIIELGGRGISTSTMNCIAVLNDEEIWLTGVIPVDSIRSTPHNYLLNIANAVHWSERDGPKLYLFEGVKINGEIYPMDLHGVRNFNNSLHFIGSLGCTEVFQDTIVFHDLRELNGLWYGYERTALTRNGKLYIFGNPGFLAELVQETALERIQVRRIQLPSALPVSSFFAVDRDDYYISAWSDQTVESYFWRRKENELINYDLPNLREFGAMRVTGLWSSSDKLFAISHPQLFIESFSDTADRKYILYTKYMEAGRPEIAPIAIDGRASNDVFFCGPRGTIGHYNGKTVKFYYELQDKIQNIVLRDIKVSEGKVFAVGSGALSGKISAVLVVGTKY